MRSESGSAVLYHKTGLHSAVEILKSKKLKLAPAGRSQVEVDMNRDYSYYLSFGRTVTAKYNKLSSGTVQLVFDGSALGSRYKIVPVDYWGEDYRKAANGDYEQEDRLLSDKPNIKLVGLTEVHVFVDRMSDTQRRQLRALALLCKRSGIKVYVYNNQKSAQLLKRSDSVPLSALTLKTDKPIMRYRERGERRDSGAHAIVELLLKKQGQQLSENADLYLRYIRYGEFAVQYSNVLNNYRHSSEKEEAKIHDLIRLTKRLGLHNPNEVSDYIKGRWAA